MMKLWFVIKVFLIRVHEESVWSAGSAALHHHSHRSSLPLHPWCQRVCSGKSWLPSASSVSSIPSYVVMLCTSVFVTSSIHVHTTYDNHHHHHPHLQITIDAFSQTFGYVKLIWTYFRVNQCSCFLRSSCQLVFSSHFTSRERKLRSIWFFWLHLLLLKLTLLVNIIIFIRLRVSCDILQESWSHSSTRVLSSRHSSWPQLWLLDWLPSPSRPSTTSQTSALSSALDSWSSSLEDSSRCS